MGQTHNKKTIIQTENPSDIQQFDTRMVQNTLLIWLDSKIDEANTDCQDTISHLRRVMNTINIFTDSDECVQFLEKIQYDKVCMIVSGSLGKHIIPHVHNMSQIESIFIFCGNTQSNEQWAQDWPKIKGVYTDIKLICYALKQSVKDSEQNGIGFSLMRPGDISKGLNQLDPMFIYMWILKDTLLGIEFEPQHLLDFTQYCREVLEKDKKNELNNIINFQQDYGKKTPMWWYTWESFLYPLINQALCLSDISVIMKMGFFIKDLYQQIDDIHQKQFTNTNADQQLTVYRGQGMSRNVFEKVLKTKGGLISINNFLSTSMDKAAPMKYVERALLNPDKVGVLFVIQIKSNQSTTPFASVSGVGAYKEKKDEIIFAMNTLFRIRDIKQMGRNTCLFRLKLELISENDNDLQMLKKCICDETLINLQGWSRLGAVLLKLKRPKDGEQVYKTILQQETEESKNGWLYNGLGLCKYEQREYEGAIEFYRKSIEIYEKYSPNGPNLAMSFNHIALAYDEVGECTRALSYYEKALAIKQQSLSPNNPDLENLYDNISSVYEEMGEYAKAVSYKEKILEIKQQVFPPDHLNLIGPYNNIGVVYEQMENYSKANSFYEEAVQHAEQSLPANHPKLIFCKNNRNRVKKML